MNESYVLGDIVLVSRGQYTRFFEVIHLEGDDIWVTDGHIQTKKTHNDLELICRAENRKDKRVPNMKYFK